MCSVMSRSLATPNECSRSVTGRGTSSTEISSTVTSLGRDLIFFSFFSSSSAFSPDSSVRRGVCGSRTAARATTGSPIGTAASSSVTFFDSDASDWRFSSSSSSFGGAASVVVDDRRLSAVILARSRQERRKASLMKDGTREKRPPPEKLRQYVVP